MFTDPIQFYFVKTSSPAPISSDLDTITQQLSTYDEEGFSIKRTNTSLIISFDDNRTKSILSLSAKPEFSDTLISGQMVLTCEKGDHISVNILRNIIRNMGYRVFNPAIGCFDSQDPDLLDLTSLDVNPKIREVLKKHGFDPLFNYKNNLIFFARKTKEEQIYLINSQLLLHLVEKGEKEFIDEDFFKVVADNLGQFIALYDKGLIQGAFYEKREPFVNHSGFGFSPLGRDVYLRPVFFKYNAEKQSFEQFNRAVERRDLLKKGDKFKKYSTKILTDLNIKGKIITAEIMRGIEYEELEKKLIPRFNVGIYIA